MSFVCHSYVLVCYPYVTRMWFYHEPKAGYKTFLLQLIAMTLIADKKKLPENVVKSDLPSKKILKSWI